MTNHHPTIRHRLGVQPVYRKPISISEISPYLMCQIALVNKTPGPYLLRFIYFRERNCIGCCLLIQDHLCSRNRGIST